MNMDTNNNETRKGRPGVLNGQEGSWVQVDPSEVPASVSRDINNPTMAADGSYYYAEGGNNSNDGFGPIGANYNNAIPTPSRIVQLPPIVQPIALVPYASQNQPLLQYDPNERPPVQAMAQEPVYRAKPYAALSVLFILLAVGACVVAALLKSIVAVSSVTAIDSVMGLAAMFKIGSFTSVYNNEVLQTVFAGGFSAGFKADMKTALFAFLIPVFYALTLIMAVVLIIVYLLKLGKRVSPGGFNVFALIGLLLSVANVVIMIISTSLAQAMGAYIIAGIFLVLFVLPLFVSKKAQTVDYVASKKAFIYE